MPLGIQQNNSFIKLTVDVWQDKVFYNEQEYPAGYFATAVLNISGDEIMELMEAGSAVLAHHRIVVSGNKRKLGALIPTLKSDLLRLAELLWKYPPFCFNDKEQERHLIEVMLAPETLNDISRYGSPARDFSCGIWMPSSVSRPPSTTLPTLAAILKQLTCEDLRNAVRPIWPWPRMTALATSCSGVPCMICRHRILSRSPSRRT